MRQGDLSHQPKIKGLLTVRIFYHLRGHLCFKISMKVILSFIKIRYDQSINKSSLQRSIMDKKSIKKQILAVHSTLKPFSCPVCNRDFALKNYLQRHMKVHAKHQDTYGQISIFLEPRLPLLVDFDNNENI